nr:MAG TPA: hypothetical protein [Caudoviricetes sp.]
MIPSVSKMAGGIFVLISCDRRNRLEAVCTG